MSFFCLFSPLTHHSRRLYLFSAFFALLPGDTPEFEMIYSFAEGYCQKAIERSCT
ncbi:hypothetical protein MRBBS_2308 [Marinobacter sp. BSs20148]|nr:hypothetical protein MRBBS_2308 [Marinobacter sp. BSs20148]